MDKKIYIIGLLVDELKNEVTEKDFAGDKLKELEEVAAGLADKCLELKEENVKIKLKRAKGMLSADIVMKDLFGDGYKYAGMDALRKNIKAKMDRHEKTKEENAALKKDRDEWKSVSEGKLLGALDENKELKEEIDKLKAENKGLKLFSRRAFKAKLDEIGHAEMTDMVGQLSYIKKDMDAHKEDAAAHELLMGIIDELCDETKTSTKDDGDPSVRVDVLRGAYNNKTLNLDALRIHLGKSKRGSELLKQFDRAKTDK